MWRGFWGLGFALPSLPLPLHTDKKLQKITSRRGLAKAAEHVRKKRAQKINQKPRRNPAKSVHVCAVWTGWRVKLLQKGAEICASSRSSKRQHILHTILATALGLFADISHVICTWCAADWTLSPLVTPFSFSSSCSSVCHLKLHVICLKAIQLYGVSNGLTVSQSRLCCGSSTCI